MSDDKKPPEQTTLADLSDAELRAQVKSAKEELRQRAIIRLRAEECQCDRYTCYRCQQLQALRYADAG